MTIPEDEIPTAKVDLTILGGKVKYERGATVAKDRVAEAH